MGDLKARLQPLFRRSSTFSSTRSSTSDSPITPNQWEEGRSWSKSTTRLSKNRKQSLPIPVFEDTEPLPHVPPSIPSDIPTQGEATHTPAISPETPRTPPPDKNIPTLAIEAPTPKLTGRSEEGLEVEEPLGKQPGHLAEADAYSSIAPSPSHIAHREQSNIDNSQLHVIDNLLRPESPHRLPANLESLGSSPTSLMMQRRKIWVKRPGSSATQVMINEEDLVDDVRDMILKKYANSLGRSFDSPDVTLRIIFRRPSGRHTQTERMLGPEEAVSKILEINYPGGQAVEEALVIDVPQKRTPKHSPHMAIAHYLTDDVRPRENGTDYFPPMPPPGQRSPHLPTNMPVPSPQTSSHQASRSIGVLTTGHPTNLPSPGGRMVRQSHARPKFGRQHTSSPTTAQGVANAQQSHGRLVQYG
jgi:hypothetical protein